jgi:mRNA interferase MazF
MLKVPERGDVVWIQLTHPTESPISHHQPGLVISPGIYNQKVGLVLICPITRQVKGYPFEVLIPETYPINGAVLSDQVSSVNWQNHSLTLEYQLSSVIVEEVLQKLNTLICV